MEIEGISSRISLLDSQIAAIQEDINKAVNENNSMRENNLRHERTALINERSVWVGRLPPLSGEIGSNNNVENALQVVWNAIVNSIVNKGPNSRMWTLQNGIKWDSKITALYNRVCYDELLTAIEGKDEVLIYGTPGIGKSLFLMVLLVHIVETARSANRAIPSIGYCRYENKIVEKYFLLSNGNMEVYNKTKHGVPDYLLSDSVDIDQHGLSKILSIEVASDKDINYNNFMKRIGESGDTGLQLIMPLFTFDELLHIKPKPLSTLKNPNPAVISDEEASFRYRVFGGSARNFVNMQIVQCKFAQSDIEPLMLWMFGGTTKTAFPYSWQNVINRLSNKLNPNIAKDVPNVVNSFIIHLDVEEGSIYASNFMRILVATLVEKSNSSFLECIKGLIGSCGIGVAFEQLGHKKITTCDAEYKLFALNKPYEKNPIVDTVMKFNYPIRLIRSIEDIRNLNDNEYGLPTISNFPLVDAVIQPNTLINFTTSNTHTGAVDKLDDILAQLQDRKNARFIIVTKHENLKSFKYMPGLSKIHQYVTSYDPMAVLMDPTVLSASESSFGDSIECLSGTQAMALSESSASNATVVCGANISSDNADTEYKEPSRKRKLTAVSVSHL